MASVNCVMRSKASGVYSVFCPSGLVRFLSLPAASRTRCVSRLRGSFTLTKSPTSYVKVITLLRGSVIVSGWPILWGDALKVSKGVRDGMVQGVCHGTRESASHFLWHLSTNGLYEAVRGAHELCASIRSHFSVSKRLPNVRFYRQSFTTLTSVSRYALAADGKDC